MSKHTQDFVQVIFEYAYMHESIDSYVIDENKVFLCTIETPKCKMLFDEWIDEHNIQFDEEVWSELSIDENGSYCGHFAYTMELKEYIKYFRDE